jgi:hypothetical protein
MANYFIVAGYIPTIIATIIAKRYYSKDINILVSQISLNSAKHQRYVDSSAKGHNESVRSFHKVGNWEKILEIVVKYNLKPPHEKKNIKTIRGKLRHIAGIQTFENKLRYIAGVPTFANINDIKRKLNNSVKISRKDNVFVSDNTTFWTLLDNYYLKVNYIEHGVSAYNINLTLNSYNVKETLKGYFRFCLKYLYCLFYKKPAIVFIGMKYLTDGNQCEPIKKFRKTHANYKSIDCSKDIKILFQRYFKVLEVEYSDCYQELLDLEQEFRKHKNVYLYLPDDTSVIDNFETRFRKQIEKHNINAKDSIFLIKNHPRDSADFSQYFSNSDLSVRTLKMDLNKYLPAEMLLLFFNNIILFSTYSSTVAYSKWWLNKNFIFYDIEDSNLRSFTRNEYKGIIDLFD